VFASVTAFVIALAMFFSDEGAQATRGETPFTPQQIQYYESQVRPILKAHCLKCHGDGPKIRAGFRLNSRAAVLRGGELGPAVSLGQPETSRLLRAIRYEDDDLQMPPAGKLPAAEIDALTRWVKDGLPWSSESATALAGAGPAGASAATTVKPQSRRDDWSLRAVSRPPVPAVKNRQWCRNSIDAFLARRHETESLKPAAEADRVTLIRRLTYDLTGLPPTPAEVDAFAADSAEGAYERLVDRLLASPHYGEKWGRHWLDLVRYGETDGYERDAAKPFVWRYRDYVITAFNQDKPFDQFVQEQLAGDELSPASA
jgi:Protein of unknown function (DUF1549)/Planctomycete cytochrome C